MTLTTNNPYSTIDSILDTFFNTNPNVVKSSFRFAENSGFPKLNIFSKKNSEGINTLIVEAAISGYSPDEIEVKIDKNILSFSHSHSKTIDGWNEDDENSRVYLNEIKKSSFTRKVLLPDSLDFDSAKISYENGILCVSINEDVKKAPKVLKLEVQKSIA